MPKTYLDGKQVKNWYIDGQKAKRVRRDGQIIFDQASGSGQFQVNIGVFRDTGLEIPSYGYYSGTISAWSAVPPGGDISPKPPIAFGKSKILCIRATDFSSWTFDITFDNLGVPAIEGMWRSLTIDNVTIPRSAFTVSSDPSNNSYYFLYPTPAYNPEIFWGTSGVRNVTFNP